MAVPALANHVQRQGREFVMFIIFGWEQTVKPEATLFKSYCYRCRNDAAWDLYAVTKWISFFFIRVIPFHSRKFLCCSICGDSIELDSQAYGRMRWGGQESNAHGEAISLLEAHQLADKTETQRNFLRATRET